MRTANGDIDVAMKLRECSRTGNESTATPFGEVRSPSHMP
jgi:hypothetical protein